MLEFPIHLIVPVVAMIHQSGTIQFADGRTEPHFSLWLTFEPLTIDFRELPGFVPDPDLSADYLIWDWEGIIMAEIAELPLTDFERLADEGAVLEFPTNPEDGFVEASTYFYSQHFPVDIHSIAFSRGATGEVNLRINSTWILGNEFADFPLEFTVGFDPRLHSFMLEAERTDWQDYLSSQ